MGIRHRTGRKARRNSAVPAKKITSSELQRASGVPEAEIDHHAEFSAKMEWSDVRITAAKLYGRGYKRSQIARALLDHLYPANGAARTEEQRLSSARQKLRRWEYSQEFRDLVWQYAVVDLDMDSSAILVGLSRRAKRGRVDAARLALELTGRHSKDSDTAPVNVTVNLANVA